MMDLQENLQQVEANICKACENAGRKRTPNGTRTSLLPSDAKREERELSTTAHRHGR